MVDLPNFAIGEDDKAFVDRAIETLQKGELSYFEYTRLYRECIDRMPQTPMVRYMRDYPASAKYLAGMLSGLMYEKDDEDAVFIITKYINKENGL